MNKSQKEVKMAEKLSKHFGWTDWMTDKVMAEETIFYAANRIMEWEEEEEEHLHSAYIMRREKEE